MVFFDEFDAIGKERGDEHETGEIKRVVSSLLLNIDALPSYVVVVTATNHPELLDRAVWRRFQLRLELPPPNREAVAEWLRRFELRSDLKLGLTAKQIDEHLTRLSYAELEEFYGRPSTPRPAGREARREVRGGIASLPAVDSVSGSEVGDAVAVATASHFAAGLEATLHSATAARRRSKQSKEGAAGRAAPRAEVH